MYLVKSLVFAIGLSPLSGLRTCKVGHWVCPQYACCTAAFQVFFLHCSKTLDLPAKSVPRLDQHIGARRVAQRLIPRLTRLARRHLRAGPALEPAFPFGPPRPFVELGPLQPVIGAALHLRVGVVAVFLLL